VLTTCYPQDLTAFESEKSDLALPHKAGDIEIRELFCIWEG